jgi:hypothetical protein
MTGVISMKFRLVYLMIAVSLVLIAVSCSEDDPVAPTAPATIQKALALGMILLNDGDLEMQTMINSLDGGKPAVDSVLVGGHVAELDDGFMFLSSVVAHIERDAGSYTPGDSIDIRFYAPTGSGTSAVRLLDRDWDKPEIISYATSYPYDTIAIAEEIAMSWEQSPNADWYGVNVSYEYDSSGVYREWREFSVVDAPPFTVPGTRLSYNGRCYISVLAVTGPRPDHVGGNISGGVFAGFMNSYAPDYCNIYIGTGVTGGSPATPSEALDDLELMKLIHGL